MDFLVALTLWLVVCWLVGQYAASEGQSAPAVFLISFFLSPLAGVVVILAMGSDGESIRFKKGVKKCPLCDGFAQADAKVCRFCRYKFGASPTPTAIKSASGSSIPAEVPVPCAAPILGRRPVARVDCHGRSLPEHMKEGGYEGSIAQAKRSGAA
jgi:hypothetical protein